MYDGQTFKNFRIFRTPRSKKRQKHPFADSFPHEPKQADARQNKTSSAFYPTVADSDCIANLLMRGKKQFVCKQSSE
jgi:hypothetical protein